MNGPRPTAAVGSERVSDAAGSDPDRDRGAVLDPVAALAAQRTAALAGDPDVHLPALLLARPGREARCAPAAAAGMPSRRETVGETDRGQRLEADKQADTGDPGKPWAGRWTGRQKDGDRPETANAEPWWNLAASQVRAARGSGELAQGLTRPLAPAPLRRPLLPGFGHRRSREQSEMPPHHSPHATHACVSPARLIGGWRAKGRERQPADVERPDIPPDKRELRRPGGGGGSGGWRRAVRITTCGLHVLVRAVLRTLCLATWWRRRQRFP